MWIIKLGGSLAKAPEIHDWLHLVAKHGHGKLVIVPGGGIFADCVRQEQQRLHLSDTTAHEMAVQAMKQMALVFQDLQPDLVIADSIEQIRSDLSNNKAVIWSPDINWLNAQQIPACWDITSDSLAAVLASALAADHLILVKSAAIAENATILDGSNEGIVDKAFCDRVENVIFNISLLNKSDIKSMLVLLKIYFAEL